MTQERSVQQRLLLETPLVSVNISGSAEAAICAGAGSLQVLSTSTYALRLRGLSQPDTDRVCDGIRFGQYAPAPLLLRQECCTLALTPREGHVVSFRCEDLLGGCLASGAEITQLQSFELCVPEAPTLCMLVLSVDGVRHLRLMIEVGSPALSLQALRLADDSAHQLCMQLDAHMDWDALSDRSIDRVDAAAVCAAMFGSLFSGLLQATEPLFSPAAGKGSVQKPRKKAVGELSAPALIHDLHRAQRPLGLLSRAEEQLCWLQQHMPQLSDGLQPIRSVLCRQRDSLLHPSCVLREDVSQVLSDYEQLLGQAASVQQACASYGQDTLRQYAVRCVQQAESLLWKPQEEADDRQARNVLVGSLRGSDQLASCLAGRFYHIPAERLDASALPIRYVAIYQSPRLFGEQAGLRYYGAVSGCTLVRRHEITERFRSTEVPYYRFSVTEWKQRQTPAVPTGMRGPDGLTTCVQLLHSPDMTGLWIGSEPEFRLYYALSRAAREAEASGGSRREPLRVSGAQIIFTHGAVCIKRDESTRAVFSLADFLRRPGPVFEEICRSLSEQS